MTMNMKATNRRRPGVLIFAVLATLALAATLCGVWLKILLLERNQVRQQEALVQAQYLADAALARAEVRLAANPAFAGETWEISAAALGSQAPATVTIATAQPDETSRRIRARVAWSTSPSTTIARTAERNVNLPAAESPAEDTPAEDNSPAANPPTEEQTP